MNKRSKFFCFVLAAVFAVVSHAGFFGYNPKKDVTNLIITGNYFNSRLIADMVQGTNRQPYILVHPSESDCVFFVPDGDEGLKVPIKDFTRFVRFLNPKKILVLGDDRYVPEKFIKLIDENQPVIPVSNKDWQMNAKEVGDLLNLYNLAGDYKDFIENKSSLYSPEALKPRGGGTESGAVEEIELDIDTAVPVEIIPVESVPADPVPVEAPVLIMDSEVVPK